MEENTTVNPGAMPSNREIRNAASQLLKGNWLYPVLCTILFFALASITGTIPLGGLLVFCPLVFGFSLTFLLFVRGETTDDDLVTKPFMVFKNYGRYLGASILVYIFTFLWSLLFIIPGIVKGYSYALTPYITHDQPALPVRECLRRSQQMMKGYKMKLLMLYLSYLGWAGLCILTFGFGFLILQPYIRTSVAAFYHDITGKEIAPAPASAPQAE